MRLAAAGLREAAWTTCSSAICVRYAFMLYVFVASVCYVCLSFGAESRTHSSSAGLDSERIIFAGEAAWTTCCRAQCTSADERLVEYGWKPHQDLLLRNNLSRASIDWYPREQSRCTVSSSSKFQTALPPTSPLRLRLLRLPEHVIRLDYSIM